MISFNVKGIHPHDLAQFLNEDNIAIRVGHPVHSHYWKLKSNLYWAFKFYLYNDESDIDKFCDSLIKTKIISNGNNIARHFLDEEIIREKSFRDKVDNMDLDKFHGKGLLLKVYV